jgi:hypothetical protein
MAIINLSKLSTIIFLVVFSINGLAQESNKDVFITSIGSGKTLEDAKQAALRSATEQAFGAFISAKTEIVNDALIRDEIISVSNGNIKSYEIINQDQLPDGRWGVTIKSVVSVDKLTSFVQAKGIAVEIKGGLFALNVKQQLLNEQGEVKAVSEMVGLLHELMQTAFDYTIKTSDPKSLDDESENWQIPIEVTAKCNKNFDFCTNYFIKTIIALSLSSAEVDSYKSINKKVFPIRINCFSYGKTTFQLRKQASINILNAFFTNWEFYIRLFSMQSGIDASHGLGEGPIHKIVNVSNMGEMTILFPNPGAIVGVFASNDKRTLNQIEQLTGYIVKPRGVVSAFKNGGFVAYEKDGHGLVVCMSTFSDEMTWSEAKKTCNDLDLFGYNDWYLPSKDKLKLIYQSKTNVKYGLLNEDFDEDIDLFWSSSESSTSDLSRPAPFDEIRTSQYGPLESAWVFNFQDGSMEDVSKDRGFYFRAFRSF